MRCGVDDATKLMVQYLFKLSREICDKTYGMDALTGTFPTHPDNVAQYQKFRGVLLASSALLLMGADELMCIDSRFVEALELINEVRRDKLVELVRDKDITQEKADETLEDIRKTEEYFGLDEDEPPVETVPSVN